MDKKTPSVLSIMEGVARTKAGSWGAGAVDGPHASGSPWFSGLGSELFAEPSLGLGRPQGGGRGEVGPAGISQERLERMRQSRGIPAEGVAKPKLG